MNELEPTPLEAVEDMLTPVAAMVNPDVAARADELKNTTPNVARIPRTSKLYLCMAETFLRAACTLPAWLDEILFLRLSGSADILLLALRIAPTFIRR